MLHSKKEGEGFPLLILHGFLGMSDNWKTLATKYAEQGFQVHSLDLQNHGKSFHSDDFNYEIMVQDVVDYCAFHHLTSVDVIGHSMGGMISLTIALREPQLVERVLLRLAFEQYRSGIVAARTRRQGRQPSDILDAARGPNKSAARE